MYVPGSLKVTCTVTRPSGGNCGATHTGAHGELAPTRVSSHDMICSGENVTLPLPRYTNHDTCRPTFLPTVTRAGGNMARLIVVVVVTLREPALLTADPDKPEPRRFGMPSSVTTAASGTASPTLASRDLRPWSSSCGGLLARTSGLLVPAASAPVSDARTTSSI